MNKQETVLAALNTDTSRQAMENLMVALWSQMSSSSTAGILNVQKREEELRNISSNGDTLVAAVRNAALIKHQRIEEVPEDARGLAEKIAEQLDHRPVFNRAGAQTLGAA